MNTAPIVLFVYNRRNCLPATIEALLKNKEAVQSDLFVYSDGGKNKEDWKRVYVVREYVKSVYGFKSMNVIERTENMGLADSVIAGVTEIIQKFGRVIVLEDDLLVSPHFLEYMNQALNMYESEKKVGSVNAFMYSLTEELPESFFLRVSDSWGWGTWKDRWELFEPDAKKLLGKIKEKKLTKKFDLDGSYPYTQMLKGQTRGLTDSWAIRWYASLFLEGRLSLYYAKSLVENIGGNDLGTHTKHNFFGGDVYLKSVRLTRQSSTEENHQAVEAIQKYFKKPKIFFVILSIRMRNSFRMLMLKFGIRKRKRHYII